MKKSLSFFLSSALLFSLLTGCGFQAAPDPAPFPADTDIPFDVDILLSDDGITVDGQAISTETTQRVYAAHDIVFYSEGQDFTYGEGSSQDEHPQSEANEHTVVHIAQPGTYRISGTLSAGQIAVDLGEDAKGNPDAVVTLLLDGMDITCSVAPGVIFYNVYECGTTDADSASNTVDTTPAGANVIIADDSRNYVDGSYVARIHKPGSVELSEDGSKVVDSKKLHKYDAAFYSKMSMNIYGGEAGTGFLNIDAENEGLDSELHLTIHGGNINIFSGNDGINTNEDGISVTTINGGNLTIDVTGETGEGDGIDSNGWLVINGGRVMAMACSDSADAGIDSDMGIHINGGTVIATGHMLDRIEDGGQTLAVFQFAQTQEDGKVVSLKNEAGDEVLALYPGNAYSNLIYSSPDLAEGSYTLYRGGIPLTHSGRPGGMGAGMRPGGFWGVEPPESFGPGQMPEGMEPPEGLDDRERPAALNGFVNMEDLPDRKFTPNEDGTITLPDGTVVEPGTWEDGRPNGGFPPDGGEPVSEFFIVPGENYFSGIASLE